MSRNNRVHRTLVRTLIAALTLGIAVLAGCGVRTVRFVHHPATAKVVVVEKSHQHTAKCGHYKYKGKWYKAKKHKHGKKCGHRHVDGVWVYTP